MRKFFFKVFTFLVIPFIVLNFLAMPSINFVTFRAWETLTPCDQGAFPGPFYPNQYLAIAEEGDLGHGTQYSVPKDVVFITDEYGYRYSGDEQDRYPIVIVGDSFTAGSGLTQDDTLSEVLARKLGTSVYAFAPGNMDAFATQGRFTQHPPDIVILQRIEREILPGNLCSLPDNLSAKPPKPQAAGRFQDIRIHLDRVQRFPLYLDQYLDSVDKRARHAQELIVDAPSRMLFYPESIPMVPVSQVDAVVRELVVCDGWLADQGIQLVFLPVPDKENIYYDRIPGEYRPLDGPVDRGEYMRRLIATLRKESVKAIDTQSALEAARAKGKDLYQLDDTHWNRDGVRVVADLLADMLSND